MASLDRVGDAYEEGSAQMLCMGCQRFFNDLDSDAREELTQAVVRASEEPPEQLDVKGLRSFF